MIVPAAERHNFRGSNEPVADRPPQPSSPPRGVAISGIIFSALYIASVVLVRIAVPADPAEPGEWLTDPVYRNWVGISLNLVPFAGIALIFPLWVMLVSIYILYSDFQQAREEVHFGFRSPQRPATAARPRV